MVTWGLPRTAGRVYAYLLLRSSPVSRGRVLARRRHDEMAAVIEDLNNELPALLRRMRERRRA
jgi:hypothetical protein